MVPQAFPLTRPRPAASPLPHTCHVTVASTELLPVFCRKWGLWVALKYKQECIKMPGGQIGSWLWPLDGQGLNL